MNASHLYNDIWCFDFITKVWNQVEAVGYIPAPREGCAAALELSGSSAALPRFGHGAAMIDNQHLLIYGGFHKGNTKKNLFLIDTSNKKTYSQNAVWSQFF